MTIPEYYAACKKILYNKFKLWIINDRPFTARQLLLAIQSARVEMAALSADAGPKAIVDACMCRLLKEYSMSSAKGFNRILVKRLLHSFYCCVPAGNAAVPNITAMLSIDSADQSTTGFVLSNAGTVDGSTDITDNPDYTYKFTVTIDSVDVFSITGVGGSNSGAWTFGNWHPNIVTNGTQSQYIAACSGTIDPTGITIADHYNATGFYALHAIMLQDGIITYSMFNWAGTNFGYTRNCQMSVTKNSTTANATGVTIPNIYAPITFSHKGGSLFSFSSFAQRHFINWGNGAKSLTFGSSAFSRSYGGTSSNTYISEIWGLQTITTMIADGPDNDTIGTLNFNHFTMLNAVIEFNEVLFTGFTTPVNSTGTIQGLGISRPMFAANGPSIRFADLALSSTGLLAGSIQLWPGNFSTLEMPKSGKLRTLTCPANGTLSTVNFFPLASTLSILGNAYILFTQCTALNQSAIDQLYSDIDLLSAGVIGATGTISTSGSATPTGGASNANVLSLQAKGYTVTL